MKKLFVAVAALTLMSTAAFAQNTFNKGDKVLNLGIGLGSTLNASGYNTVLPPISASLEFGVVDNLFNDSNCTLGVGGYLGISSSKYDYSSYGLSWTGKYNYTVFGARGAVHYQLVDKLDTYAGLMLGYNNASYSVTGTGASGAASSSAGGFTTDLFVGARYYLSDNFAVMGELGYGIAALNLGVALKF